CSAPYYTQEGMTCASMSCPNDRWYVEGRLKNKSSIECGRDPEDWSRYTWLWEGVEIGNASCTTDIECSINSTLNFECPDKIEFCALAKISIGRRDISCQEGFQLQYRLTPSSKPVLLSSLTCDLSTGLYMNTSQSTIPRNASVYCTLLANKTSPSAARTDSFVTGSVVTGVSGLVLLVTLVAGIVLIVLIVRLRRSTVDTAIEEEPEVKRRKRGNVNAMRNRHTKEMSTRSGRANKAEKDRTIKMKLVPPASYKYIECKVYSYIPTPPGTYPP
ncbi:hypothetical protein PFISCL1PPCAC_17401, partial [Pristionchus fissidentatus]